MQYKTYIWSIQHGLRLGYSGLCGTWNTRLGGEQSASPACFLYLEKMAQHHLTSLDSWIQLTSSARHTLSPRSHTNTPRLSGAFDRLSTNGKGPRLEFLLCPYVSTLFFVAHTVLTLLSISFVDRDMFMQYLGNGIGHKGMWDLWEMLKKDGLENPDEGLTMDESDEDEMGMVVNRERGGGGAESETDEEDEEGGGDGEMNDTDDDDGDGLEDGEEGWLEDEEGRYGYAPL
jgi:hypothetical protein